MNTTSAKFGRTLSFQKDSQDVRRTTNMSAKESLIHTIGRHHDIDEYRDLHWEGSFEDYLALLREDPRVTRNAYQRVYDMVMSYGTEEYIDNKKKIVRYNFFKDE